MSLYVTKLHLEIIALLKWLWFIANRIAINSRAAQTTVELLFRIILHRDIPVVLSGLFLLYRSTECTTERQEKLYEQARAKAASKTRNP